MCAYFVWSCDCACFKSHMLCVVFVSVVISGAHSSLSAHWGSDTDRSGHRPAGPAFFPLYYRSEWPLDRSPQRHPPTSERADKSETETLPAASLQHAHAARNLSLAVLPHGRAALLCTCITHQRTRITHQHTCMSNPHVCAAGGRFLEKTRPTKVRCTSATAEPTSR